jgi:hypothetical protein
MTGYTQKIGSDNNAVQNNGVAGNGWNQCILVQPVVPNTESTLFNFPPTLILSLIGLYQYIALELAVVVV